MTLISQLHALKTDKVSHKHWDSMSTPQPPHSATSWVRCLWLPDPPCGRWSLTFWASYTFLFWFMEVENQNVWFWPDRKNMFQILRFPLPRFWNNSISFPKLNFFDKRKKKVFECWQGARRVLGEVFRFWNFWTGGACIGPGFPIADHHKGELGGGRRELPSLSHPRQLLF